MENIPTRLGKIQKQLIFNVKPDSTNKGKVFDSVVSFMEFRDFSLTDSVRPTYAVFKRKRGVIAFLFGSDVIKVRIKELENQLYVMIGSNMADEEKKEKFDDEIDALKQFVNNKFKLKSED